VTGPDQRAVIVGAGLAGSLCAVQLARAGWEVVVYEARPDPRHTRAAGGRSINLGLSARGIAALDRAGLLAGVLAAAVPMRGRLVHGPRGRIRFQRYGIRGSEVLHSILRADLNIALVEAAERHERVRIRFDHALASLDADRGAVEVAVTGSGARVHDRADLIVGADGAFSEVRRQLGRRGLVRSVTRSLDWGYKELSIPAGPDGLPRTPLEGLHVWPGGEHGLMVAHPNRNASLTATLFLPLHGERSLATLTDRPAVEEYLATHFPDTVTLMPDRVQEFLDHPVGRLVTVRTDTWSYRDRVVLIGDAAHAVYPFYGQGMNAAFEDVLVLSECLADDPDRSRALATFQHRRQRHTDALAEVSAQNFEELRARVRSPWFRLRRRADLALHRLAPTAWVPLYTMIAHRTTPYADARARARRQDRLLAAALSAAGVLAGGALTAALLGATRTSATRGRSPC
jgi:kynurenine 3-monooxygenase